MFEQKFKNNISKSLTRNITQILKKNDIDKKDTKECLMEKINKLKLLNTILIERIRELELDLPHEISIACESIAEQPPLSHDETKGKTIIQSEIGLEDKLPPFIDDKKETINNVALFEVLGNLPKGRNTSSLASVNSKNKNLLPYLTE